MPYPPRPPTGQAVSAALKRAGFNRSAVLIGTGRYRDGRLVKGSDQHTWGYEVRTIQGRITVRHILGGIGPVSDEGAKRYILDLYMSTAALVEHPPVMGEGHPYAGKISVQDYFDARRELAVLRPVVVALAAIYSDHPDYRQEWKEWRP